MEEKASKRTVATAAAPEAIGPYSQAVVHGDTVYLSGQIPLDPRTMALVEGDFAVQAHRVIDNLAAVAEACDAGLDDLVKLTVYLTDLDDFPALNEVMQARFAPPYPARAAVGVAALPKGARLEIEGILRRPEPARAVDVTSHAFDG